MKRLILILALLFSALNLQAQHKEECQVKYYVQIGADISNIYVLCNKQTTIEFRIFNTQGSQLSRFSYIVEKGSEMLQLSLAGFPPATYFVTVNNGDRTVRFSMNTSNLNP